MDSQSYLNEISQSVRPQKQSKMNFFKNKFFLIGAIGVVGVILMAIIGAMLSGGRAGVQEQSFALELRFSNLIETISTYQPNVKSSELRSSSASLNGILSNSKSELSEYIQETFKGKKAEKKTTDSEKEHLEALKNELFQAKINGILDRIYAHKMSYEIALVMAMEDTLYDATSNDKLRSILDNSYNSLRNLKEQFDQYSEAN